ncbi:hypothetical protein K493DRAFT_260242 [Basidiobolus meristosporus CBS 931.73]|uniref:Ribonuclease n=1 Tax=Basidiobolus meristosporus CBS 931.73 TaxID=1314790 RepID=A0A1Y1YCS1_9FUNG|nr:hypothetical protein K493DRAFT_260242 [Basidiobolus meristosporus CBS 931.73]|eukprot:ORX95772.1 hypothetical protein K493DRAFT_260242 [Basidiobolus meristosporus CBS 931.73]
MLLPEGPLLKSYTYATPPPEIVQREAKIPCILGVDEAGRGPVLGPMVYGICYCPLSMKEKIEELGFVDSKTLIEEKREEHLALINENSEFIGWSVRVLSPQDISHGMLGKSKYNLNSQAHDTTIQLIRDTLKKGVNVTEVYIDTVGPPDAYQRKLQEIFPAIQITVAKKADSLYPIVSAASICAKVTRDHVLKDWVFAESGIENVSREFGSGYPSDPKTVAWLQSNLDPVFGYPNIIRFSWSTCSRLLDSEGVKVAWESEENSNSLVKMFNSKSDERCDYFKNRCLQVVNDF